VSGNNSLSIFSLISEEIDYPSIDPVVVGVDGLGVMVDWTDNFEDLGGNPLDADVVPIRPQRGEPSPMERILATLAETQKTLVESQEAQKCDLKQVATFNHQLAANMSKQIDDRFDKFARSQAQQSLVPVAATPKEQAWKMGFELLQIILGAAKSALGDGGDGEMNDE